MTWLLFTMLSWFMLKPTFEPIQVTAKEKTIILYLIKDSKSLDNCSITWPVGLKKWTIVLWLTCVENNKIFNAKLGIDYINKLRLRLR